MKTEFVGRKVELKPAFCDKAKKRVEKLERFFSPEAQAHITVTVGKDFQTVEATIRDKGFVVRSERTGEKMETALDAAFDLITRRIVKNKRRLETKLHRADFSGFADIDMSETEEDFTVIREKRFAVKPCTVEDAILEMNMLGHEFYTFCNDQSGAIEVCYRRKDGSYGVLIPELH